MDAPSRNQRSSIEALQIGRLFEEEDLSDGTVVENHDYTIASCMDDCE